MNRNQYYQYFVEGENEEKIVNILKSELKIIAAGKVQKFNITQQKLTKLRLMSLKRGTKVVLVFDTDAGNYDILSDNIKFLQNESLISEVICITQVYNLEDELVRSCNINSVTELTKSRSKKEFKHDMIRDNNFAGKLKKYGFDFQKFWCTSDPGQYKKIKNEAFKIKLL